MAVVLLLPGCLGLSSARQSPEPPPAPAAPPPVRGVVFAADGAGGFQATSRSLRDTIAAAGLPVCVESVPWSHGYCRIVSDQVHHSHIKAAGDHLARRVLDWKRDHPDQAIYLLGHSAGSAVVLRAAEQLPAGTVERIVLLAPAVSASYDLRPALATACRGIDVFHSERDWGYLGLGVLLTGTADRHWAAAAGRVGFRPPAPTCPEDVALYARLHQHPWSPCLSWTGNHGGHYGAYQPGFLQAFVLPLLRPAG